MLYKFKVKDNIVFDVEQIDNISINYYSIFTSMYGIELTINGDLRTIIIDMDTDKYNIENNDLINLYKTYKLIITSYLRNNKIDNILS
jgi:hypothetical protein